MSRFIFKIENLLTENSFVIQNASIKSGKWCDGARDQNLSEFSSKVNYNEKITLKICPNESIDTGIEGQINLFNSENENLCQIIFKIFENQSQNELSVKCDEIDYYMESDSENFEGENFNEHHLTLLRYKNKADEIDGENIYEDGVNDIISEIMAKREKV
jgi:hypothetical protein